MGLFRKNTMLRRTLLTAAASAALALSFSTSAFAFAEGTDYVVLDKPLPNAEKTLTKVWSYDCPFCFKYDIGVDPRVLPQIEEKTGLKFVPVHLETKGKFGRTASEYLAMCQLKDEAAGLKSTDKDSLYKKAKGAWYQAYHKKGERWVEGEAAFVKTASDATGIAAADFEKDRKDPAVIALADSWKVTYDVAKIQGIPAYVVNGKYLIMTRSIRNFDGMVKLVEELAAK